MVSSRNYGCFKTLRETRIDFQDLFRLWEVEAEDWKVVQLNEGGYQVQWWMPYDTHVHEVSCNTQRTPDANLRVIYHFVAALQKNAQRGVLAAYGGHRYLALLPGSPNSDTGRVKAGGSQPVERTRRYKGLRAACERLGVRETADQGIVDASYRHLAKSAHPDAGGSAEAMALLTEARDIIYGRRGWTAVDPEP